MAASSQPAATTVGVGILCEGGTAADACVAMAAALAVTEPCSTGLGGDAFALFFDARTRQVTALNGSGAAPRALSADLARTRGWVESDPLEGTPALPPRHASSVTVPGACAAWCDLAARHGTMPLPRLLAPAIALARDGFPVEPITAHFWARGADAMLRGTPGGTIFAPGGRAPAAGESFRNPDLARTLALVAEGGAEPFYRGTIARAVARAVREAGGVLDEKDLAAHASSWEEPISVRYRSLRVWECPPNGQGIAALLALRIVEGFDLARQAPDGAERIHLLVEAMRLAFEDARARVADPRSAPVPVEALLSDAHVAARRGAIHPGRSSAAGVPSSTGGTVYLCAVDGAGNACSFINSNYMGFGTGIAPEGCGFTLQNRGHGFSLREGHPNLLAPGKRPYHTIMPGMLTREADGSLAGPFGVMGGFMQPQGHLQVVCAIEDDRVDPQETLERPRFCIRPASVRGELLIEEGIPDACADALRAMGHPVRFPVSGMDRSAVFGRGQIILRLPDGSLQGGSDPRADGEAAGTR